MRSSPPPPTGTSAGEGESSLGQTGPSEEQRRRDTLMLVHASAPVTNKADEAHRALGFNYWDFQGTRYKLLEKRPRKNTENEQQSNLVAQSQPPSSIFQQSVVYHHHHIRTESQDGTTEVTSTYGGSMTEYFMSSALDPRAKEALGFQVGSFGHSDEEVGESSRKRRKVDENLPPARVLVPGSPVYHPLNSFGFSQPPLAQWTAEGLASAKPDESIMLSGTPSKISDLEPQIILSSVTSNPESQSRIESSAKVVAAEEEPVSPHKSSQSTQVTILSSAEIPDSQPSYKASSGSNNSERHKETRNEDSVPETPARDLKAAEGNTSSESIPYRLPLATVYETPLPNKPTTSPATNEYRFKKAAPNSESLSPLSSLSASLPSTGASPNSHPSRFPLFTGKAPQRKTLLDLLRKQARTEADKHTSPAEELSIDHFIASPPDPDIDSNPRNITSTMKCIIKKSPRVLIHFQPTLRKRELSAFERGYWRVDLRKWSKECHVVSKSGNVERKSLSDRKLHFWKQLTDHVKAGRLGETRVFFEDHHEGSGDGYGDIIRIYCYGEAVIHIWVALFILSERAIAYSDLEWIDSAGNAIIVM